MIDMTGWPAAAVAHCQSLMDELAKARQGMARLEEALGVCVDGPNIFRLTPNERRIFGVLMRRDRAPKAALHAAVCYRAHAKRDEPEPKGVDVLICKVRRKLKPHGITIETLFGEGYRMPAESKAKVRAMMEQQA